MYVDYSFLGNLGLESSFMPTPAPSKNVVTASNKDADALYKLWESGKNNMTGEFDIEQTKELTQLSARDITRLKTLGLITAHADKATITERGRKVLITMTLNEPNNFQLKAQKKPYNEILAGMDRKKKGGLRCASFATNNNNCLDLSKTASYHHSEYWKGLGIDGNELHYFRQWYQKKYNEDPYTSISTATTPEETEHDISRDQAEVDYFLRKVWPVLRQNIENPI